MELTGRIENGVVVLHGACILPEGAEVTVLYRPSAKMPEGKDNCRIQFPLVRTGEPRTVDLTNAQIEDLLSADDVSP